MADSGDKKGSQVGMLPKAPVLWQRSGFG